MKIKYYKSDFEKRSNMYGFLGNLLQRKYKPALKQVLQINNFKTWNTVDNERMKY